MELVVLNGGLGLAEREEKTAGSNSKRLLRPATNSIEMHKLNYVRTIFHRNQCAEA